jgi:hypothetical protein
MRKLSSVLTVAAAILLSGNWAAQADPATTSGGTISRAAKNFSPIREAACRGFGAHCPPGFVWTCGPYGRCWCRPCG